MTPISVNDVYPSKWLSPEDLTRAAVVTIADVLVESVRQRDGSNANRITVGFQRATKRLICNKTQALALAQQFGDDAEKWPGKQVMLSQGRAPNGKPTITVSAPARTDHGFDSLPSAPNSVHNQPQRPFTPDYLRQELRRRAEENKRPASEDLRRLALRNLTTLAGDPTNQNNLLFFFFEKHVARAGQPPQPLTAGECEALNWWINVKIVGGESLPSAHAIDEARAILTQLADTQFDAEDEEGEEDAEG